MEIFQGLMIGLFVFFMIFLVNGFTRQMSQRAREREEKFQAKMKQEFETFKRSQDEKSANPPS